MSESVDASVGFTPAGKKDSNVLRLREALLILGEKLKLVPETPPIVRGKEEPHAWKERDFDATQAIKAKPGPLIEIAGPTPSGYESVDVNRLGRPLVTSNITPGYPEWDDQTGAPISYTHNETMVKMAHRFPVDFQADATRLPFADGSIAVVFARCLDRDLICPALREAFRATKDGGFWVGERLSLDGIRFAQALGYIIKQYSGAADDNGFTWWNYILQKPEVQTR